MGEEIVLDTHRKAHFSLVHYRFKGYNKNAKNNAQKTVNVNVKKDYANMFNKNINLNNLNSLQKTFKVNNLFNVV